MIGQQTAECSVTPSLDTLWNRIMTRESPYTDLAEQIEDSIFRECESVGFTPVMAGLERVTHFFETLPFKSEAHTRDLAALYVLAGELLQYYKRPAESIEWFSKGVIANDRYGPTYHSLAVSHLELGNVEDAIRCLEQELLLCPGNYYSYLLLAQLYERTNQSPMAERTLERVLERDPDNVLALHRLICHYEKMEPQVSAQLLRRRLTGVMRDFNRTELLIWVYHLCVEGRSSDALGYLTKKETVASDMSIINLLKAHLYGELKCYAKKRKELARFKEKNDGRESFMQGKIRDFEEIFGRAAAQRLVQRLLLSRPGNRGGH